MKNHPNEAIEIAIALIRRTTEAGKVEWLVVGQDPLSSVSRDHLSLITGERLLKESFRETVSREVAWQLGLDREKDFLVSSMARLNYSGSELFPGSVQPVYLAAAFFVVDIYRKRPSEAIERNPRCLWIDSAELVSGQSRCGIPVDSRMVYLIRKTGVIQSWESFPEK